MKVTYTPEDADEQTWDFKPGRVRSSRGQMIETRYHKLTATEKPIAYLQWRMDCLMGYVSAQRVLLWHLRTLEHPTLKIADVDPMVDELKVEPTHSELLEMREAIEAATNLDEVQKEMAFAQIDAQLDLTAEDDSGGKAQPATSSDATG